MKSLGHIASTVAELGFNVRVVVHPSSISSLYYIWPKEWGVQMRPKSLSSETAASSLPPTMPPTWQEQQLSIAFLKLLFWDVIDWRWWFHRCILIFSLNLLKFFLQTSKYHANAGLFLLFTVRDSLQTSFHGRTMCLSHIFCILPHPPQSLPKTTTEIHHKFVQLTT